MKFFYTVERPGGTFSPWAERPGRKIAPCAERPGGMFYSIKKFRLVVVCNVTRSGGKGEGGGGGT